MKKTLIILLFNLFIPILLIHAKTDKAAIAAGLSIIVPGSGQIYNGQFVKAALIAGTETVTGYYIYEFNKKSMDENDEQEKITYKNYRNNMIWLLSGEIVYSSIDAFIEAKMANMNKKIDISVKGGGIYICYRF
ncbi:MAG: hypothetical protein GWP03_03675 [Proteobacteria bacterium]|nr:hypothetical protein [Pseudomonadota bacterium]